MAKTMLIVSTGDETYVVGPFPSREDARAWEDESGVEAGIGDVLGVATVLTPAAAEKRIRFAHYPQTTANREV